MKCRIWFAKPPGTARASAQLPRKISATGSKIAAAARMGPAGAGIFSWLEIGFPGSKSGPGAPRLRSAVPLRAWAQRASALHRSFRRRRVLRAAPNGASSAIPSPARRARRRARPAASPHRIVRPRSAWYCVTASIAAGCGGSVPWTMESPASSGMATRIGGRSLRCAAAATMGSSSTRPTSKKTGIPTTMPNASSAQGRPRRSANLHQRSAQRRCAAAGGQQAAQHRAQAEHNGDVAHQIADAGCEGERNLLPAAFPKPRPA